MGWLEWLGVDKEELAREELAKATPHQIRDLLREGLPMLRPDQWQAVLDSVLAEVNRRAERPLFR